VILTVWVQGDPDKLESVAAENPDRMRAIADKAKENGLIAHRFYGTEGQVMVIEEWPDEESFQRFFEQERSEIDWVMAEGGATSEPQVRFWRKLETHDEVGWTD
jgi:quinol monooxygenase YgiN